MPTPPPLIDPLPQAPNSGSPATFQPLANPFVAALPPFRTQQNALAQNVFNNAADAEDAAAAADQSKQAAALSAQASGEQAAISTGKAGEALLSAQAAEQSKNAAAALLDQFSDAFLGAFAADPALDNDGNALANGAVYFNTVAQAIRVYGTTVGWISFPAATAGAVQNLPAGNLQGTTVQEALNELDAEKVAKTGNESIAGEKTFIDRAKFTAASGIELESASPRVEMSRTGGGAAQVMLYVDADGLLKIAQSDGNGTVTTLRFTLNQTTGVLTCADVTITSDERRKKDWESIPDNLVDQLAMVLAGTYTDIQTEERRVGVGAQSLQRVMEQAVNVDEAGTLSVSYGPAALVGVIALCRRMKVLEERLAQLEPAG